MTPEDWAVVATEVRDGIIEAGTTGTLLEPGTLTGPENNPTQGDPVPHSVFIVYDEWNGQEIDGSLILATDQKILVAATGVEPQVNWQFQGADGKTLEVVPPLNIVKPGGVPVLYELNLRG